MSCAEDIILHHTFLSSAYYILPASLFTMFSEPLLDTVVNKDLIINTAKNTLRNEHSTVINLNFLAS